MVFQNLKKSDYAYLTRKDLHLLKREEDAPPAKINRMVANRQVVHLVKPLHAEMRTIFSVFRIP